MININVCDLKPAKVFEFFSEITNIPRSSGNTQAIADYCLDFAQKRNLNATKDNIGNIVIYKNGTKGYENSPPLILQGHLDIVWDTIADYNSDLIQMCTDGEFIWAKGSTLGADNGIALAYILTILDSTDIPHPPIEALFTVDEEIGMIGATKLDSSLLKGKRLINLDSEEEGVLTVSCAGGVRIKCQIPVSFNQPKDNTVNYKIKVLGLNGGHSGIDIHKHRKSAVVIMARLLQLISHHIDLHICDIKGDNKVNAIPNKCSCVIAIEKEHVDTFKNIVDDFTATVKKEYSTIEPNLEIDSVEYAPCKVVTDEESTKAIIFTLLQIPKGVQTMSPDIPNMVQTSLNFGDLALEGNWLQMTFLVRSNASTGKQFAVQKLTSFVNFLKGEYEILSDYPVWEYKTTSQLRDIMVSTYTDMYGEEPVVTALHAGLECGILSSKIFDADMVSIGPDIFDVHTVKEKLSVQSAERCFDYLLKVIEKCK